MLKNCFLSTNYNNLPNKTCGEIVCQTETSFTIVCKYCDLKIFDFNEFVQHFRDTHWPQIGFVDIPNKSTIINEQFFIHEAYKDERIIKSEVNLEETDLYEQYKVNDDSEHEFEPSDLDEWVPENETAQQTLNNSSDMEQSIGIFKKKAPPVKKKGRPFKCNMCNMTFSRKTHCESHIQKHESFEFKCDKCEKTFPRKSQLTRHLYLHTGYPCTHCDKVFEKYDSLRYHRETHIDTRNFVCDYNDCKKAFATKRRMNSHKRQHVIQPKLVCEICGARHRHQKDLSDHIRTHTGEKPFACALCDRRFTSKSLLCEHQACHEVERNHICDVCGKSFNRPKALYHHKHLHLAVKKFACKICDAAYAQAAGLSAHMRKHKEERITAIKNTQTTSPNMFSSFFL